MELINTKKLYIKKTTLGMLENNVYLIRTDNQTAIVDPSCQPDAIMNFLGEQNLDKILITHYHWDHLRAGAKIKNLTSAITYASKIDSPFIENPENAPLYRQTDGFYIDKKLNNNDIVKIGQTNWRVIATPGHTPGSICFYNQDVQPILISGDTLFESSCGRTDFADGNTEDMKNSLKILSKLDPETIVLPGHGNITKIKDEISWINQI